MMESSRTKEKGKAPVYADSISSNTHPYRGLTFYQGNVDEDDFDSILDTRFPIAGWDDIHRSVAQGVPEPIPNPRVWTMNPNCLQNPQTNMSSHFGGESSFRSVTSSSSLFCPSGTAPDHTQNNVNFSTNQSGVQLDSREIKIARDCKATGQTFDDGFRCSQSNKGFGSLGSLNGGPGSNPHQILHRQHHDRRVVRPDKLKEAAPTELKMDRDRKVTAEPLDADFMGFHRNNIGFYNQFSNVDRMASTNYEAGVHNTFNSGLGSSRQSMLQKQKNKDRNIRFGDMDQSSRMSFNYTPSDHIKRSHSTANSPNYAGQVTSQNDAHAPTQVLGGNLSSQRTETPQGSWVGRGLAGINALFSKRLRNNPQSPKGHHSTMETSLQTTNTGQVCQFKDEGSTRMPHDVLRRPIGRSDGPYVSYPMSQQEPFFTYGQSQNALIQFSRGPQGTPSTNASSDDSQSQKLDFHVRPHHKRTAVAPPSASHWVQSKKRIHPTIHHSMPKPPKHVTADLIHPSIHVGSRTQPPGPIAAHIRRVIPRAPIVKPHAHVASAPAVSHITWKDPDVAFKLSGYKCFLCKKDVGFTSEGVVFQPAVPQPVAVLPCGHTFHDQCLQNITPDDQAKDPPCIPCAISEN